MSRTVKLPSGASLYIDLAGFTEGKAVYQAFLEELKSLKVEPDGDLDAGLAKDLICMTFSSKKVEDAIWECMARCTYNKVQITKDTFEPESARGDYFDVLMEVGRENIRPFMKGLLQKYGAILNAAWAAFLVSMQKRMTSSTSSGSRAPGTAPSSTSGKEPLAGT